MNHQQKSSNNKYRWGIAIVLIVLVLAAGYFYFWYNSPYQKSLRIKETTINNYTNGKRFKLDINDPHVAEIKSEVERIYKNRGEAILSVFDNRE